MRNHHQQARKTKRTVGWWLLASGVMALSASCGDDDGQQPDPEPPVARFQLAPVDFFAQPWPSDLRYGADGRIDLTGFPEGDTLVQDLVDAAARECTGFSVGGAVYFSFDAEVDPASLPADGLETAPVCDNFAGPTGVSTAVVVQYMPSPGHDGHFVVFDHMTAKRQSAAFLASHAVSGCPSLVE